VKAVSGLKREEVFGGRQKDSSIDKVCFERSRGEEGRAPKRLGSAKGEGIVGDDNTESLGIGGYGEHESCRVNGSSVTAGADNLEVGGFRASIRGCLSVLLRRKVQPKRKDGDAILAKARALPTLSPKGRGWGITCGCI
jgi:hypothetical protein